MSRIHRLSVRAAWLRSSVVLALAAAASPAALAQPANNLCDRAIVVTQGSYPGTIVGATPDTQNAGCFSAGSADVWYRYTAQFDGRLTVDLCTGTNYDSAIGIWSGCPSAGGEEISCNDDSCGLQSRSSTVTSVGTEYWIRVTGYGGSTGPFTLTVAESEDTGGGGTGADVVYSDILDVAHYGPVGGVHAYAFGTATCNIGTADLWWGGSWGGSPVVGFNAYRLRDGRLTQLGQSWVKMACCAAAGDGCAIGCNGVGGDHLGVGCMDVYGASYNGFQSNLAKRSSLNAFTGDVSLVTGSGNDVFARLQVQSADIDPAQNPGALYFAEGVYVATDDAASGNAANNASYRRATFAAGGAMSLTGATQIGVAAIQAWRDHGNGVGVPDPSVTVEPLDVPEEGRFIVATKVRDLGNGQWRYDYAVLNINSDLCGGSFSVPVPAGVTVGNVGFHDVPYHSGEPYDNTDWSSSTAGGAVTWSSPQTFAQNTNSNALRWGTMYNFWFDADRPPTAGDVALGLFKPHTPQVVTLASRVPAPPPLAGDLNGDGHVDLTDLATLLANYGCSTPPCTGDVDADGDTDLTDLALLLTNFGL